MILCRMECDFMTKTEIINAKNNELIIKLVDTYTVIVGKNGQRCATENKELNNIAYELVNRGLLEKDDIEYLNM